MKVPRLYLFVFIFIGVMAIVGAFLVYKMIVALSQSRYFAPEKAESDAEAAVGGSDWRGVVYVGKVLRLTVV